MIPMYSFVYITNPDAQSAKELAKKLVSEKLLACANIFSPMTSIYHWEGKLCEESEVLLVGKTRSDLVSQLEKRVSELHSYDCPCILSFKIDHGHPPYLKWLGEQL